MSHSSHPLEMTLSKERIHAADCQWARSRTRDAASCSHNSNSWTMVRAGQDVERLTF
ncbi:MAG: hypothetical protein MUF25_21885 [Pirellulaceae bacterium]|nr:hypothetical protein [Pirellulaceae bacterium]